MIRNGLTSGPAAPVHESSGWAAALRVQARVVTALMLRETKTRFGRTRLGYLWALCEPIAHVAVLAGVAGALSRPGLSGIDFPVFLITGIVPWLLFSGTVSRVLSAVDANRALLHYPQVRPLDLLVARAGLELTTYVLIFAVLGSASAVLGFDARVEDPLCVLAVLVVVSVGAFGLGAVAAAAAMWLPAVERIVPLTLRPLYFASGIFFTLEMLPEPFVPLLDWNPLLHAIDLLRDGYFTAFTATRASFSYVVGAAVVSLLFGLMAFHHAARRVGPT